MKNLTILSRTVILTLVVGILTIGAHAQSDQLTLAEILTGLQSQSSGLSISEKNAFITNRVEQRGVTFSMSTEIRNELIRAGASTSLINSIERNGPKTVVTRRGTAENIEFDQLWVTYDVTEGGKKGMRVHTKLTIANLLNESLLLTMRIQKDDGDVLMAKGDGFRNKAGQLAVFRSLKPAYNPAVYNDLSVFIPYSEFDLPAGVHKLKVDADIIYPDGTLLKHLKLHPFEYRLGVPATQAQSVKLNRMWIDHRVRSGGKLGMRINSDVSITNMKGVTMRMAYFIQTSGGAPVKALTQKFRTTGGNLVGIRNLQVPSSDSSRYRNVSVFIPYEEITGVGNITDFKIHADILYGDGKDLHVTYYDFSVPVTGNTNSTSVNATLNSLNILHNQTVGGRRGMYVDVDFNLKGLKDQNVTLIAKVENSNGVAIRGRSSDFRTSGGQLNASKVLNPVYDSARFRNQRLFIPYDEFVVGRGIQNLRVHVDVLYSGTREAHVTIRNFSRRF